MSWDQRQHCYPWLILCKIGCVVGEQVWNPVVPHGGHDVGIVDLPAPCSGLIDQFQKERGDATIIFGDPEASLGVFD
jgi:hypothetical protein